METTAVVMIAAGLSAGSGMRRYAPTHVLITGTGASGAGADWRGLPRFTRLVERDSAPWAPPLV